MPVISSAKMTSKLKKILKQFFPIVKLFLFWINTGRMKIENAMIFTPQKEFVELILLQVERISGI
jgi:hypothetical protein